MPNIVSVENGVYGLAISLDSGFVEITKNENKDSFQFKGQFLNARPN